MILEHIHLTNFRCFESLHIPLDRHLNVFIGRNGTGTTTILDSIALALAPIPARLRMERNGRARPISLSDLRVTAGGRVVPFLQLAAAGLAGGSVPISWDRIRLRDLLIATRNEAPAGQKELDELESYLDRITEAHHATQPYKLPVVALYRTTRAMDVPYNRLQKRALSKHFKRLAGLENALESKADLRDAVGWFDSFERREQRDRRDRIISATLPALDVVRRAISSMIPEVSNPRIDRTTGRFAVDIRDLEGHAIQLDLDQLPDSYQAMLAVVMDFALRMALANPPEEPEDDVLAREAILIIDEVDLHLHPSWQRRVIPDLRRTFPNTQLILTTHSPQVALTVPSTNLRILRGSQLDSAPAGTEGGDAQRLLEDMFLVESDHLISLPPKLGMRISD